MDNQQDILEPYYDFLDSDMLKLQIKPTNLPFKGLGLFATGSFSKGEVISEYYGSVVSAKASQSEVFNEQDKLVQADQQVCVIGRCPASRINDIVAFDSSCYQSQQYEKIKELKEFPVHKGFRTNAKLALDSRQKVFIKSRRDIQQGEEIYISYGFSYWDFFHQYQYEKKLRSKL